MFKKSGLRSALWVGVVLLFTFLLAACGAPKKGSQQPAEGGKGKTAESPADFYKGKLVNFIVPYEPGGGYDLYPRMVVPYLQKVLGGNIAVQNKPGGGSLVGTNEIYKAKPDGLTIGVINGGGTLSSTIAGADGVLFDLKKFTYLGRFVAEPMLLVVGKGFEADTVEKMQKLQKPMKLGTEGMGSNGYNIAVLIKEALGIPMDIITGYGSSKETDLAVTRGEIDAQIGSPSSRMPSIKNGDVKPVLVVASKKYADLPNTPIVVDMKMTDENMSMVKAMIGLLEVGRAIVAPPGVPAERAKFLTEALDKTFKDPELLDVAKKSQRPLENATPDEISKMVGQSLNAPAKFNKMIKDSYKPAK